MSWDIKIGDGDHRNSAHRVDGLSCKAGVSSNGGSDRAKLIRDALGVSDLIGY